MRFRLLAALCLGTIASGACASRGAVPMVGAPGDLERLVGEWEGEYSSAATGRSGTIRFDLTAAADTAHGEVVMIPRGRTEPYGPDRYAEADSHWAAFEVLHLDFVQLQGSRLRGQLAPYRDPDCGCVLLTVFEGALVREDRIEGEFISRVSDTGDEATGRWFVNRRN